MSILKGVVLEALARAAHGDPNPYAVRTVDPILKALGRRRVRRALAEAGRLTSVSEATHVARLAYVTVARGVPDGSMDDAPAIAQLFAESGGNAPPRPRSGPWISAPLALAVILGAAAIATAAWMGRPFDPRRDPTGHALSATLGDLVVALSRRSPPPRATQASADIGRALGADAAKAWDEMSAAMIEVAASPAHTDRYYAAVGAFDAALARAHAPYFVDADLVARADGSAWPMVYSFYVDRESEATTASGNARVRVLDVWRLDSLAISQPFLGYTHPRAGAALVLLDQIELELIDLVLPALGDGQRIELTDDEARKTASATQDSWVDTVEQRGGEIVRASFAADADRAALAQIGDLLSRRLRIVRKWQSELPLVGVRLVPPRRLVPEGDYAADLRHRASKASLDEWDAIHEELLRPATIATFERLRDRFARSTQRHEVQHRLDYARGLVPMPELLATRLGVHDPLAVPPASYAAHCRDETSAYLAQMAEGSDAPALTFLLLSQFLFDRDQWGSAYSCAAQMVTELVGRALGTPDAQAPLVGYGRVLREVLAARFVAITATPERDLRAAARRAWADAYGVELAAVSSHEVARHRAWRH